MATTKKSTKTTAKPSRPNEADAVPAPAGARAPGAPAPELLGPDGEPVLRQPAEVAYADQLEALRQNESDTPPPSWRLSPRSVLTYIVGGQTLTATIRG
jgi:hypothetical protein